ncbi:hypothetical protein [Dactylosporangium roseum]|uniref:hypothetical protein n=1 Tax=Dactylosporangium roseum TaxID=47989 RepID=UPI0021B49E07|nr:hypothetical protein [Dactylosporangium roseum]
MLVIVLIAVLAGCTATARPAPATGPSDDPGALIEGRTALLARDGPYRDPDQVERSRGRDAAQLLLAQPDNVTDLDAAFGRLGYTAAHGVDSATGRRYSMYSTSPTAEPAWGVVLIDRSAPLRFVLEVPHPGFDTNTDKIGVALYHLVPGSVLLVAGAHRAAADGAADVAHNDKSMFNVLATEFAKGGLKQIQLHGFADNNLPDAQVVVSTGAGRAIPLARDLANGLQGAGLVVCRAWAAKCGRLEGTTNVQGKAADEIGAQFVHLEMGWAVRGDPQRRDVVVHAIAGCL